jgi:hypothetical protein
MGSKTARRDFPYRVSNVHPYTILIPHRAFFSTETVTLCI